MVVITDITIPADQFALGRLLEEFPDIAIELERLVPLREGIIPLIWVEGGERNAIEATIREDPLTKHVQYLTELDGRFLLEIEWSIEIDTLVQPLISSGAEVLRATGTVNVWDFRLQFRNRAELAAFRKECVENGVDIHLKALYNPSLPELERKDSLTDEQYDILATAYENGFWQVPRGIELGEVASLIGISSNAASQRMRRGLNTIVGEAIKPDYT